MTYRQEKLFLKLLVQARLKACTSVSFPVSIPISIIQKSERKRKKKLMHIEKLLDLFHEKY